jgi:hypothetical protein
MNSQRCGACINARKSDPASDRANHCKLNSCPCRPRWTVGLHSEVKWEARLGDRAPRIPRGNDE